MKKVLAPEVEKCRVGGIPNNGPLGLFSLVHPNTGRRLNCVVADAREWHMKHKKPSPEEIKFIPLAKRKIIEQIWGDLKEITLPDPPWDHVSVKAPFGLPIWEEMCFIKDVFWEPHECVIQFHPAREDYVSIHDDVLHLWSPVGVEIPTPPKFCV